MTQRLPVFFVLVCAMIALSLQVFVSAGRDDTSTLFNRMGTATSTPSPSCPDGDSSSNVIFCDTAPEWSATDPNDTNLESFDGDDHVYIFDYASGGDDDVMPIDGGAGDDKLLFLLFVDDWYLFQAMTDDINAADPANGSLYNMLTNQTYQWTNFETLVAALQFTGDPTMTPSPIPISYPPACQDSVFIVTCNIAPEAGGNNDDVLNVNGPEDTWVYIQEGADGGADDILHVVGNTGHDILRFQLFINDYNNYLWFSDQIRNADPASGSFVNLENGDTYSWQDFEELSPEFIYRGGATPTPTATDGPSPTPTATDGPSPTYTLTPAPTLTATDGPSPTHTPPPTDTPGPPTLTPTPVTPTLTPTSTPGSNGFPALERYYPANGQTITSADTWPYFQFEALTGVTWYQVWIGSDDYTELVHAEWYQSSSICSDGVCTLPEDVWLMNDDYVWWMTYWGPDYNNVDAYWHQTFFEVAISAPPLPANLTVPDTSAPNPAFTWDHSANALWYHVVLAPADFAWVYDMGWHQAADLNCSDGTCTYVDLVLAGLLPADDYIFYVMAWGPDGSSIGGTFGYAEGTFSYAP